MNPRWFPRILFPLLAIAMVAASCGDDDDPSGQLYGAVHDRFDPHQWMDDKVIAGTDGFAVSMFGEITTTAYVDIPLPAIQ